jgi:hypothetical protein
MFNLKHFKLLIAVALLCTRSLFAQQVHWVSPPNVWYLASTTLSYGTMPWSTTNPFVVSNSASDQSGNILFYIHNNEVLKGSDGSSIGQLKPFYINGIRETNNDFGAVDGNNFEEIGPEIALVPVPGACKQYYIIYSMGNGISPSNFLLYMKLDMAPATPVLSSPNAGFYPYGSGSVYRQISNINTDALSGVGVAISKKLSNGDRYLFSGGRSSIYRHTITSTGIASVQLISNATDEPTLFNSLRNDCNELELSPDQQWLGWGNTATSKLNAIKLNTSYTKISGASKSYALAGIKGLEFNTGSTRIYVSEPVLGIRYADLSGTTLTSFASATTMNNTYLERAKNGRIYGVNNSGQLQAINESTSVLYAAQTSPLIYSNGTNNAIYGQIVYHLPDQVDGEDISSFPAPVASVKINGVSPAPTGCLTPQQTFGCSSAAITLTNSSTDAISYKIDLLSATTSCGTYSLIHSTGVVTTFPTNAKNLPGSGSNGTWLQSHTGYFQIVVTASNLCGVQSVQTLYINVQSAPTGVFSKFYTKARTKQNQALTVGSCTVPASTSIQGREIKYYYDATTGTSTCDGTAGYNFLMEHISVLTPNKVGRTSTSLEFPDISAGTGSMNYTVYMKCEKWSGSVWLPMHDPLLYPLGEDLGEGTTFVELDQLLQYDPSSPYYNAFTTASIMPNNAIARLTLTVSNECGNYSSVQIIQIDEDHLKIAVASGEEMSEDPEIIGLTTYPNPAAEAVNFTFNALEGDLIGISLYDISGRKAFGMIETSKSNGEQVYEVPVSKLTPGGYLYKVEVNDRTFTGQIVRQ